MARLGRRVAALTTRLLAGLLHGRHPGGAPLFRLYGPADLSQRGGTVTFNLLDRRGRVIPYDVVETRARNAGVAVRGGCFCNLGSSEAAFRLPAAGAIRASVGVATSEEDLRRALATFARIALRRR